MKIKNDMAKPTIQGVPHAPRKRASVAGIPGPIGRPITTGTRKRVNLDSLAARLGPQVIRELDALITPGSKEMPSFAERRAIQERYNVNRRHVYDWYHTKGFRVTKEDMQADDSGRSTAARTQRREISKNPPPLSTPEMSLDTSEDGTDGSFSSPDLLLTPANPGDGHFGVLEDGPSFAGQFPAHGWHHYYGPPQTPVLGHIDFQGKPDLIPSAVTTPIIPATAKGRPVGVSEVLPVDTHIAGCGPTVEQNENVGSYLPPDLSGLLSGSERLALFSSLSGILGPPIGIQENVGTYKAYMEQQNQLYYEALLPSPRPSSATGAGTDVHRITDPSTLLHPPQPVRDASPLVPQGHMNFSVTIPSNLAHVDKVRTQQHHRNGDLAASHQAAAVTAEGHPNSLPRLATTPSVSTFANTVNLPQPSPALELRDILESPLLRSRNPSHVGHGLYALNPAHAWHPLQAPGLPTVNAPGLSITPSPANPMYHPAMFGQVPTWQVPCMAPGPHPTGAAPGWEQGTFTAMLQDAVAPPSQGQGPRGPPQQTGRKKSQGHGRQRSGRTRTATAPAPGAT